MKKIFVFMGKSSSGKDTLFKELLKSATELDVVPYVLYTTRPMRENEEHGKDYFFVTDEKFEKTYSDNPVACFGWGGRLRTDLCEGQRCGHFG